MEQIKTQKQQAEYLLYECGLLEELKKYGAPHIIGSYKMDLMASNDLDIDIENTEMSLEKLYQLTFYIIEKFHPVWYEAKEEVTAEGKTVWFQGFETRISGELWNFDLWFFDKETIKQAEAFCNEIKEKVKQDSGAKEAIIRVKKDLLARELYSFEQYTSMDVYRAVLELGIRDSETFLQSYKKTDR